MYSLEILSHYIVEDRLTEACRAHGAHQVRTDTPKHGHHTLACERAASDVDLVGGRSPEARQ